MWKRKYTATKNILVQSFYSYFSSCFSSNNFSFTSLFFVGSVLFLITDFPGFRNCWKAKVMAEMKSWFCRNLPWTNIIFLFLYITNLILCLLHLFSFLYSFCIIFLLFSAVTLIFRPSTNGGINAVWKWKSLRSNILTTAAPSSGNPFLTFIFYWTSFHSLFL